MNNKVAIITDTHWGVRNDNINFIDANKRFLDNVFFPEIFKRKIDRIIHLGDLLDRRKQTNTLTAARLREDFLDVIEDHAIKTDIIVGNHDCYFKNTNLVNSLSELVDGRYINIDIHLSPNHIELYDEQILLVPWIADDIAEKSDIIIKDSNAKICMGHLELLGFEMDKGNISTHGQNSNLYDKFSIVLSGHYHHRSSKGNIHYLGSHGEFTWADYDDSRGFHIFDMKTHDLEFIRNPYSMYRKIWYNDKDRQMEDIMKIDESLYANTMVKVIVVNKNNPYWFDMFCEKIEKCGVLDMQIVEDHFNMNMINDDEMMETESTLDIFKNHINQIPKPSFNISKLENTIIDLYKRAMTKE